MQKKLRLAILGASGSVGSNLMQLLKDNSGKFEIQALSANKNYTALAKIANHFKPKTVCIGEGLSAKLKEQLYDPSICILEGKKGLLTISSLEEVDLVFILVAGASGLPILLKAIEHHKIIGLSNKESLVIAGELVSKLRLQSRSKIIPLDSEHNALHQCLENKGSSKVNRLILTASGGPFWRRDLKSFSDITKEEALKHPNWDMGPKITIDSATMMNKCLEIIEAHYLFNWPAKKISAIIHPQSIVHSLVEFKDGSYLNLMGRPDMRLPLAYCLGIFADVNSGVKALEFNKLGPLDFFDIDPLKFPTVGLAYKVLKLGAGAPAFLNGANEGLVALFLNEKISFKQLFKRLLTSVAELELYFKEPKKAPQCLIQQKNLDDALQAQNLGEEFAAKSLNL